MEVWLLALILFGSLLLFLLLGLPVAFTMGGLSLILGFFFWDGIAGLQGLILSSYQKVSEFVFVALPLYIFMASILRYSNLTDGMYEAFYKWFGGLRGGLAVATTIISTLYAAMVGVSTVALATLGLIARPSMKAKGYDDLLTSGTIMASANLGSLIPPSILMIIYAGIAEVSPGRMFMAGIVPGLLMALLFIIYGVVLCYIYPEKGPALPKEERYSLKEKFASLKRVILPLAVIAAVLVSIFFGIATPTEAAAVGVIGSLVSAILNRQLTWSNFKQMVSMTAGLVSMIFWLIIGAAAYSQVVTVTRVGNEFANMVAGLGLSPMIVLTIILLLFFIMGMFLDLGAILFIMIPVLLPLLTSMQIDLIWFGTIFILMACLANLTPPFGMTIFIYKGVVPDIKMKDLYKAVMPFIVLYIIGVILVVSFPEIALWFPNMMMGS